MRRSKSEPDETFLFEITSWEPTYALSVNFDRERQGDFVEFAEVHLETVCTLPKKQVGRDTHFILSGRRNYLSPSLQAEVNGSIPRSIGLLDLSARGGSFYGGVPHESVPIFMSGLTSGLFRYVMLSGPPLRYGTTSISHLNFMRSAELENGDK